MDKFLNFISRALIAVIFMLSGVMKVANFQAMTGVGAAAGLPLPSISMALAAVIEIGAGLALLAGWRVRWASLALFLYLIPATLIFHAAKLGDPAQAQMQMTEVLKNLAIMGGLLKFYLDGSPGRSAAPARIDDIQRRRAS